MFHIHAALALQHPICHPDILLEPDAVGEEPCSLDDKMASSPPIFLCFLFL